MTKTLPPFFSKVRIHFDHPQAVAGNHKTEEFDRIAWVKLEKLDIGLLMLFDIDKGGLNFSFG